MEHSKTNDTMTKMKIKAKRVYELSRLKRASLTLAWSVPLTWLSSYFCGQLSYAVAVGSLLSITMIAFFWLGRTWEKGALLGAMAGSIAFTLPIVSHLTGFCCFFGIELGLCVGAGVVGGVIVGTRAIKVNHDSDAYLTAAGLIMVLSGSLGCGLLGASGALGFVIGSVVAGLPVVAIHHLRFST